MSDSNCCFFTHIWVSQARDKVVSTPISLRILQFIVIHTVADFSVVNEAEVDIFLKFPCFLHYPKNFGNSISGSSALSKPSLYI